jgi:hypothetical protein
LGQFASIQPIPSAIRAFIHFDLASCAEKMAFEFDARASRAFALAGNIHLYPFIAANVQQMISGRLRFLINPLQLEGIKPNAAATAVANIDHQAAHLCLGQFVETRRAFHACKFALE